MVGEEAVPKTAAALENLDQPQVEGPAAYPRSDVAAWAIQLYFQAPILKSGYEVLDLDLLLEYVEMNPAA